MDMYVRLAMDDGGPVVVKSAAPGAQERLRAEVECLSRAVHPGVVTVVGSSVDDPRGIELRTRYAGEPVSSWTGTVASIAGLGAAVAATVADLHGVGIVHGRIDESHVLVGDAGRPRLCGFSSPSGAEPADDVAGLATVLLQLLDRASPPPGRRWRTRRARSDERAFRQVLDRAVDSVASRRPTGLALADAILLAVPSADLPAPRTTAAPDTLDRIWSAAEQGTDAERWAKALGDGPPDLPPSATPPPSPQQPSEPPSPDVLSPVPLAKVATPSWPPAGRSRLDARTATEARRKLDDATRRDRTEPPPPASITLPVGARVDHRPQSDRPTTDDAVTAERPSVAGRGNNQAPEAASLTTERPHLAGRGGLGGRAQPVEAEVEAPPQPRRNRGVVVGVAAVAVVVVGAGVLAFRVGGEGEPGSTGPPPPPPGCPAVAGPASDVDGDGCPEALAVDGATVTAGPVQWTLGEPGDIAAVGDWDCDGEASAALLRPRTGDVFAFPAWAETGAPVSVRPIEKVGGATGIRAHTGDDGCDELVIDLASGAARSVEVPT
jgi:hypothetical protein